MQCEICGKAQAEFEAEIDGAKLLVCNACKKFSSQSRELSKKPFKTESQEKPFAPELDEGLQIIQGFGQKIRQAREKNGMTLKELALKLFEKQSTLQRIENNNLLPTNEQIKKLEKALNIKLKQ